MLTFIDREPLKARRLLRGSTVLIIGLVSLQFLKEPYLRPVSMVTFALWRFCYQLKLFVRTQIFWVLQMLMGETA